MVKSLLENQTLFLEKYLHELIPAVTTCIVAKQLCTRPDVDNHWALRDFSSRLMANICKNFNTSTNNIQTRVTRMFCEALRSKSTPLVSFYGALVGLIELGQEVIKTLIIPQLSAIANRIDSSVDSNALANPNTDKKAIDHIKNVIKSKVTPVFKANTTKVESQSEMINNYGSLGPLMLAEMQKINQQSNQTVAGQQSPVVKREINPVAVPQQQVVRTPQNPSAPRYVLVNQQGQQIMTTNPGANQPRILVATTTSQNPQFYQPPQ